MALVAAIKTSIDEQREPAATLDLRLLSRPRQRRTPNLEQRADSMSQVIIAVVPGRRGTLHGAAAILILTVFLSTGCSIDKSIRVDSADQDRSYRVIDGHLDVESGYGIRSAKVIDGNLDLHENSVVTGSVRVIDGNVRMRSASRVGGGVRVIDGNLDAEEGSVIEGDVSMQHGTVDLRGLIIGGDVEVYCTGGNLFSTRVKGEFRVRKRALWYSECSTSRGVTFHPGTEIRKLIIENGAADVHVREGAIVHETVRPE
jgi:hypothetical protein